MNQLEQVMCTATAHTTRGRDGAFLCHAGTIGLPRQTGNPVGGLPGRS